MIALTLATLLSSSVLAVSGQRRTGFTGCDISTATPSLPPNQTLLVAPSTGPSYIGLAIGTQNYTCNATAATYTNVGAVAELFDISCLFGSPEFDKLQDIAYTVWKFAPPTAPISTIISYMASFSASFVLGQHYFIPAASGTGLSPTWNFSSAALAGHPDAFVVAARVGDIPAPTSPTDIDWLSLNGIQGKLATQVLRINTVGGVAPKTCKAGSPPITVKYASTYWLYGSSVEA